MWLIWRVLERNAAAFEPTGPLHPMMSASLSSLMSAETLSPGSLQPSQLCTFYSQKWTDFFFFFCLLTSSTIWSTVHAIYQRKDVPSNFFFLLKSIISLFLNCIPPSKQHGCSIRKMFLKSRFFSVKWIKFIRACERVITGMFAWLIKLLRSL